MPSTQPSPPRVTVLLATYNGRRWLPEQLDTILGQTGVAVSVVALDDGSTDGTLEWLRDRAASEPRLTILESGTPSGSAAANFYRLVERADVSAADFVSFADQDDLWALDKLARHSALAREHGYQGISSSITSFDAAGKRTLVRKSYPQRRFDFLTESPGPGSTFLMTPELFALVRRVLADDPRAHSADYHDSLVYAIARSRGLPWHIDPVPTVDYRQHEHNVMGANLGGSSALSRLGLIRQKWHRGQAVIHAEVGLRIAPDELRPGLERMRDLMTSRGLRPRLALARAAGSMRRRPRDRAIIGLLIAAGVW